MRETNSPASLRCGTWSNSAGLAHQMPDKARTYTQRRSDFGFRASLHISRNEPLRGSSYRGRCTFQAQPQSFACSKTIFDGSLSGKGLCDETQGLPVHRNYCRVPFGLSIPTVDFASIEADKLAGPDGLYIPLLHPAEYELGRFPVGTPRRVALPTPCTSTRTRLSLSRLLRSLIPLFPAVLSIDLCREL